MRRMGIAGICLLALLATSMLVAGGASAAAPEFKVCAKTAKNSENKYTGKYMDKACGIEEVKGEGKYERVSWEKAKKKKFKAKGTNVSFLIIDPTKEGEVASTLTCGQEKTEGEVTGPKTEKWSTTYKKCEVHALPEKEPPHKFEIVGSCKSSTATKAGEIKIEPLEGTLVFLDSAKKTPGLRVKPQTGTVFTKISCIEGLVEDAPSGEALLERKGNVNIANKATETIGKEGPKHGQDPYYEEEAHSETEAFTFFTFGFCVSEEVGKGKSEEEAIIACVGKFGPPPPAPVSRIAHITGAQTATAPETVVGVSSDKGEAFLIET
jgi:hypothetical protein